MGYFSKLAAEEPLRREHYPSPEEQLRWRIEDLRGRLEDILNGNEGRLYMDCRLTENDLAYAPVECFSNRFDIEAALAAANERLTLAAGKWAELHGADKAENERMMTVDIPGQSSLWRMLPCARSVLFGPELKQIA